MKSTSLFLLCAGLMLPATAGFAAAVDDAAGAGRDYSALAQEENAIAAAQAAGYTPTILEAYQNGNFLLTTTRNGGTYDVTVTPAGRVIPVRPGSPGA